MKRIRKTAAVVLAALVLLFAVLVLLGNDGVREVQWVSREVKDLPPPRGCFPAARGGHHDRPYRRRGACVL